MKRKFILLPITLTALAPIISLSGCNVGGGGDEPEPTPPEPIDVVLNEIDVDIVYIVLFTKETFNIKPNTKYEFRIDMRDWPDGYEYSHFTFAFGEEKIVPDVGRVPLTDSCEFKVGDKTLTAQHATDLYIGNIDFKIKSEFSDIVQADYIKCFVNTGKWDGTPIDCYFTFTGYTD